MDSLLNAECFIIGLEKQEERWQRSFKRAKEAGFKNIKRWLAVDATIFGIQPYKDIENPELFEARDNIYKMWEKHNVKFNYKPMWAHPTGCMLSHMELWKHIIDNEIPLSIIFEDDILFHNKWHILAPQYISWTPEDYDMIYMGHHCGNVSDKYPVVRAPVYCTHAYVLTLEGAKKIYDMIVNFPYEETHALDMMLAVLMRDMMVSGDYKLKWYVWNTEMFPDPESEKLIHPNLVEKDKGLIFQEYVN